MQVLSLEHLWMDESECCINMCTAIIITALLYSVWQKTPRYDQGLLLVVVGQDVVLCHYIIIVIIMPLHRRGVFISSDCMSVVLCVPMVMHASDASRSLCMQRCTDKDHGWLYAWAFCWGLRVYTWCLGLETWTYKVINNMVGEQQSQRVIDSSKKLYYTCVPACNCFIDWWCVLLISHA